MEGALGELPGTYIVAANCPLCTAGNEVLFTINARRDNPQAADKGAPSIDPSLPRAVFNPSNIRMGYAKTARVCVTGPTPEFIASLTAFSLRGGFEAQETTIGNPLPGCAGRTLQLRSDKNLCVLKDTLVTRTPTGQIVGQATVEAVLPSSEEAVRLESNILSDCSDLPPLLGVILGRERFRCGYDRYKIVFQSEFDAVGLVIGERLSDVRPIPALPGLRQCPFPPITVGSGGMFSEGGEFFIFDTLGARIFRPFEGEICGVEATQTILVGQCAFKRNTVQYVFPEGGGVRTRRSDHADGLFR
jgi:hypothetical protein